MTERRRFTLAGYGVFDEAMRPVDVGDQVEVVETFSGDIIVADDTLPELTAEEQAAMDEATEDFKAFMDSRKVCMAVQAFVEDDALAISFQSLGQYRAKLLEILAGTSKE